MMDLNEGLYLPMLVAGAVFLLVLLLVPNSISQRRKANEPPLGAGFLPWLGKSLQMRDMESFLASNFATHGDSFTTYAAGKRFLFTKDVVIMKHVLNNAAFFGKPIHVGSSSGS